MLWDVKLLARLLLFRDLNSKKENRGHVFESIELKRGTNLMDDTGFLLLLAVATKQASKVPVDVSSGPLPTKSTAESSTAESSASSLPVPVVKKKKDSKKKQKQTTVSTGSFFLDDSEEGQTVYRRASVYFSIVKSSRKFPGYFNPVEKRIIVNCKSSLLVLHISPFPLFAAK